MARMAMFEAGLPETVPVYAVNRQCASGLQAIASVAASISRLVLWYILWYWGHWILSHTLSYSPFLFLSNLLNLYSLLSLRSSPSDSLSVCLCLIFSLSLSSSFWLPVFPCLYISHIYLSSHPIPNEWFVLIEFTDCKYNSQWLHKLWYRCWSGIDDPQFFWISNTSE